MGLYEDDIIFKPRQRPPTLGDFFLPTRVAQPLPDLLKERSNALGKFLPIAGSDVIAEPLQNDELKIQNLLTMGAGVRPKNWPLHLPSNPIALANLEREKTIVGMAPFDPTPTYYNGGTITQGDRRHGTVRYRVDLEEFCSKMSNQALKRVRTV